MKITITDGAVTTAQDGFLSELRKWQVGEITVAGSRWFTATRSDGDNSPEVHRFGTHAERVFHVQNTAMRAGLEQLFASEEIADLLVFEREPDVPVEAYQSVFTQHEREVPDRTRGPNPDNIVEVDNSVLKDIKFVNVPGDTYEYKAEGKLPEAYWRK